MNAVQYNNLKIVKQMYYNINDINQTNKKGQTALMLAMINNDPEISQFLLQKGATSENLDNSGNNLLYYLLKGYSNNRDEQFKSKLAVLKTYDFDITSPQKNGKNWYHLAVEKQSIKLVEIASSLHQDINGKDKTGNTPLLIAAMKAKDPSILKLLVDLGADKAIKTEFNESAYDLASENELLTNNKASIGFLKL